MKTKIAIYNNLYNSESYHQFVYIGTILLTKIVYTDTHKKKKNTSW